MHPAEGLLGDSPLREGLVSGFLLIFFSELGDKTFFIAVLLALKYPLRRKLVFAGSFGALAVMTLISVPFLSPPSTPLRNLCVPTPAFRPSLIEQ